MKKFFLFCVFLFLAHQVEAEYILPYPGPMPGNKLYKIIRIVDNLQFYWSWGNIARINYFMDLSDKYLIEAKTLFEYKQYLLGVDSLRRADEAWKQIQPYIEKARLEGKDIEYLKTRHKDQASSHKELITRFKNELPPSFVWTPEKEQATDLPLENILEDSIKLRT